MGNNLTNIIATRQLKLGTDQMVTIEIEIPSPFEDGVDYYCKYRIIGIGNGRTRRGAGVDGIQALLHSLKMIGSELNASEEAKLGKLSWLDETSDFGFPLPDETSG